MPRYLVIGSGGREHALAWKLASEEDSTVFVAPGSAGIAASAGVSVVAIAADDHAGLADFAARERIDLTVVGPEAPLVAGLADYFRDRNLAVFGPGAAGAALEGSKAFAKDVMMAAGVPTARYEVFDRLEPALEFVANAPHPLVIKADGLAAGKGVVISDNAAQSATTLTAFMRDNLFGDASARVVVEEHLTGPELSFIVVTDGATVVKLATSRDHKRLLDGDQGPNTGGMGAITPSPDTSAALEDGLVQTVIKPVLAELARRGIEYRGFLYAGLMLTPTGPKVLEFNVRLGDPETQALMVAMEADLGPTLQAAAAGQLEAGSLATTRCAACIVLAAAGYPASPRRGDVISGLDDLPDHAQVFHAGTECDAGVWRTAGGRVLAVVASGDGPETARMAAYAAATRVAWAGKQMRFDIGK